MKQQQTTEPEPDCLYQSMPIETCPSRRVMVMIADKWKLMVIHTLRLGGSKRNGELRRELDGISQKMLTQTLRSLERDGLIHRRDHQEIPPRVDYELTELGQTLCEPINLLGQWGLDNFTEIENARAKFDAQTKTASAT